MNVPAPLVDDYVLGTGEGVRAIHSQCVELAETQPDAVHEFMVGAARAVAMRYCSHGDRPPQALQGNSRAARLASLKHGHPGLRGVHQAEIIAGLDPDLILEKHGTLSCRKFRNENDEMSELWAAAMLPDGCPVVAGMEASNPVAFKLDPEKGSVLWKWKGNFTHSSAFWGAAADANGSVVLAGEENSNEDNMFAVKLDSDGSLVWHSEAVGGRAVAVGQDGSAVMSGRTSTRVSIKKVDAHGELLWDWKGEGDGCFSANSVAITSDGFIVVAGSAWCAFAGEVSGKGSDLAAMKMDSNGQELWRWQDSVRPFDQVFSVASVGDGAVVISGSTQSSYSRRDEDTLQPVAIKLDAYGRPLWLWQGTSVKVNHVRASVIGPDGSLILSGSTDGHPGNSNRISGDFMAMKLNISDGTELRWRWQDGTFRNDEIWAMAARPDGRVILAGASNILPLRNDPGHVDVAAAVMIDGGYSPGSGVTVEYVPIRNTAVLYAVLGSVLIVLGLTAMWREARRRGRQGGSIQRRKITAAVVAQAAGSG